MNYIYPQKSQEKIEDIVCCLNKADEQKKLEMGYVLRNQLQELEKSKEACVEYIDTDGDIKRSQIVNSLKNKKIDLLVTYNLAGFEQCTLTDGLSYNQLDCRQLHIIEKKNLPNERFLEKEKSINMFFCRLV